MREIILCTAAKATLLVWTPELYIPKYAEINKSPINKIYLYKHGLADDLNPEGKSA